MDLCPSLAAHLLAPALLASTCTPSAPAIQNEAPSLAASSPPLIASAPPQQALPPGSVGAAASARRSPEPERGPASVEVSGTLAGAPFALHDGLATWAPYGLRVTLAAGALACGIEGKDPWIAFDVPAGPGARYYAGGTFGVPVSTGPASNDLPASAAMVSIERADARPSGLLSGSLLVRGKSLSGKVAVEAMGTFSVPVCGPAPSPLPKGIDDRALPALKPLGTAIARHDRDAPAGTIDSVWVFPNQDGTCGTPHKPNAFTFFELASIGAPSLGDKKASGPQPAALWFHPPVPPELSTGGSAFPEGEAAILWESFDPRPGGVLRGRVMWSTGSGELVHGMLVARVCAGG